MVEQISGRLGTPETGFHVDTCSGHDHMDMGMVIKAAGMGVKNCGESCSTSEFLVVFYKGLQDILDTGEHQGIDGLLVFELGPFFRQQALFAFAV